MDHSVAGRGVSLLPLPEDPEARQPKHGPGLTGLHFLMRSELRHAEETRARLESQAPEIDACVYLTECDPSAFRGGDFAEVEIVGARDYDLIARPVL